MCSALSRGYDPSCPCLSAGWSVCLSWLQVSFFMLLSEHLLICRHLPTWCGKFAIENYIVSNTLEPPWYIFRSVSTVCPPVCFKLHIQSSDRLFNCWKDHLKVLVFCSGTLITIELSNAFLTLLLLNTSNCDIIFCQISCIKYRVNQNPCQTGCNDFWYVARIMGHLAQSDLFTTSIYSSLALSIYLFLFLSLYLSCTLSLSLTPSLPLSHSRLLVVVIDFRGREIALLAVGPLACLAAALGPLTCLAAALGPLAWLT